MRCLLVDDNGTFLEAARGILGRQGVTVAGTASCTAEALRQGIVLRPDVAIVDIGLGAESGFDLARDRHPLPAEDAARGFQERPVVID